MKPPAGNCKVRWLAAAILSLGSVGLVAGCASPARPELDHLTDEPVVESLNGEYVATFHTRWFGPVYARFTAQRTSSGFKANTKPGVAWALVGGLEKLLGQVLAPFLFPSGMLLVWTSTHPDDTPGVPGEGWIGPATMDPWRLPTTMTSPDGPAVIRYRDGRALGVMTFDRAERVTMPRTDYAALNRRLREVVEGFYYDPTVLEKSAMQAFFRDLESAEPLVGDDLTYLASIALAWRKHSTVAMPLPSRRQEDRSRELLASVQDAVHSLMVQTNEKTNVATIEAVVFDDARSVDAMMEDVVSRRPAGMILDLRNCTGMDLSALRMAAWLLPQPVEAGTFIAGSRRGLLDDSTRASQPPAERVVIAAATDAAGAQRALDRNGAVTLSVLPATRTYDGPVVVLTSSRTRSTGEVLAWILKKAGRAQVVGEKTAGRPRLSREHDLGQGFVVRVDQFDWIAPVPPDKTDASHEVFVTPDVPTSRPRAPARAARLLADTFAQPTGEQAPAKPARAD